MAFVSCTAGGPVHFVLIFMKWTVCSARGRGPVGSLCVCVSVCGCTSGSRYLCLHSVLLSRARLNPGRGNVIQSLYLFSVDVPYVCFPVVLENN